MPLKRAAVFAFLLASIAAAFAAEPAAKPRTASADEVKLVEIFLKTPTERLAPEAIPAFMTIDPMGLPSKLREPYRAKKLELFALKKMADSKRKPPIRRLGLDAPRCEGPIDGSPRMIFALKFAGFVEARKSDVEDAQQETNCSECELETEFTLIRTKGKEGEGKKAQEKIRYWFYGQDPIWMFIQAHQNGAHLTTGTSFFGAGTTAKCH